MLPLNKASLADICTCSSARPSVCACLSATGAAAEVLPPTAMMESTAGRAGSLQRVARRAEREGGGVAAAGAGAGDADAAGAVAAGARGQQMVARVAPTMQQ